MISKSKPGDCLSDIEFKGTIAFIYTYQPRINTPACVLKVESLVNRLPVEVIFTPEKKTDTAVSTFKIGQRCVIKANYQGFGQSLLKKEKETAIFLNAQEIRILNFD